MTVPYFALYVSDERGPIDSDESGTSYTCVGLFGELDDAIAEARTRLADGASIEIALGVPSTRPSIEEITALRSFTRASFSSAPVPTSRRRLAARARRGRRGRARAVLHHPT